MGLAACLKIDVFQSQTGVGEPCPTATIFSWMAGLVSLVGEERARIGIFEQRFGASQVMILPRCQHQVARIAQGIDERVDFGRQPAA